MRAIWKGALTFGLVNVPVKLYAATEDHDVSLHMVHDRDGGRIRFQRRCEVCNQIVKYQDIDKAYDDGDRTVVLTDEDLASLPAERSREIEVVEFVPSDQIDPIMLDKSYFLEPDSASPKAYHLLRQTLESTDRTAIVRFALRQKTRLAALRVREGVLVIQTMLWADEVREANFPALDQKVRISDKELELSAALVESFADDFEPDQFVDEYQQELRTLIQAKLEQGDAIDTEATFGEVPEEKGGGEVIDLMEALRASVAKARGGSDAEAAADDEADESDEADAEVDEKPAAKRRASTGKAKAAASDDEDSDAEDTGTDRKTRSSGSKSTGKAAGSRKTAGSATKTAAKRPAARKSGGSTKSTASKSTAAKSTASKSKATTAKSSADGAKRRKAG